MASTSPDNLEQRSYPFLSPSVQSGGITRLLDKYFYFFMSLLIAVIVVYGFSHTVDRNLIHPAVPRPFVLYLHAAVFSGWVVFFIVQTTLIRTGKVRWHRMTGYFGAVFGGVLAALGIWTAITMERFNMIRLQRPHAPAILLVSFYDIVAFMIPFGLAVYWRKKPEFHRRLMLIATCALTAAAFSRMPILLWVPTRAFVGIGVDLLIFLGMVRDVIVSKRIHQVYFFTLPALIVSQIAVAFTYESPYWLNIAHAILA